MWILELKKIQQPHKNAKMIWINHVIHTKTKTQFHDSTWGYFTPAGQMIRHSLGPNLYVLGMLYGGGKYWKNWQKVENRSIADIPESKPNGIERVMLETELSNSFIPWIKFAEPTSAASLEFLTTDTVMRENDYFIQIMPGEWNGVVFLPEVDPATPVYKV